MLLQEIITNLNSAELKTNFKLLQGDAASVEVTGVSYDFAKLKPGFAFLGLEQEEFPPHFERRTAWDWMDKALQSKPSLILSARPQPSLDLPWLYAENLQRFSGFFAREVYARPFDGMQLVGITGTKGKTTATQLLFSVFEAAGLTPGSIGTLGNFYPKSFDPPGYLSNPLPTDIYQIGHKMHEEGARSILMEITSHGAIFERNSSLAFKAILLTNLTSDHLDFHQTVEEYHSAKMLYFERLGESECHLVLNQDDPGSASTITKLRQLGIPSQGKLYTYSLADKTADCYARVLDFSETYNHFEVFYHQQKLGEVHLRLPGLFNVSNSLGVIGIAMGIGLPWSDILNGLQKRDHIAGRFERVPKTDGRHVFIDYAHSSDSLENILQQVRKICNGQVVVVFGCGGNRDKTKRPKMGAIAANLADRVILTNDNPRYEDPQVILNEIYAGIGEDLRPKVAVIPDRKLAIHSALRSSAKGDAILIAGKGHERYQVFGNQTVGFSDFDTVVQYYHAISSSTKGQ